MGSQMASPLMTRLINMISATRSFLFKSGPLGRRLLWLALIGCLGAGLVTVRLVQAQSYEERINALNNDTSNKVTARNELADAASSLADLINRLQQQISDLQAKINDNQAKNNDLKIQIKNAEIELQKQKKLLGESIRVMYVEGDISTLEMLASSRDLSDFIDRQQYRSAVKDKVKMALDRVTELKAQLKGQKELLDKLIADQEAMRSQLYAQQEEHNRLLGLNQAQQADLNNQIRSNNMQVAELRAQQAAANRRLGGSAEAGDPGRGGYPSYLDRAPKDSLIDPWGMYNRECVSYTAWKVYQAYGRMPYWGGRGNANQWPASAQADGIPTGSAPKVGSVAISMAGYYGHAMWVEAVYPNGKIRVSQYNYELQGYYSEMTINASGLTYIYFQ